MIFQETTLLGACVIEPERIYDHRGFFARIWCQNELRQLGLKTELAQANIGFSSRLVCTGQREVAGSRAHHLDEKHGSHGRTGGFERLD